MCLPPPPVLTLSVSGSSPCFASRASRLAEPWSSMSNTRSPLLSPVGIPIFASGHLDHHERIRSGSVVALRWTFRIRGCFPGLQPGLPPHEQRPASSTECSGKTGFFRLAYQRAADTRTGVSPRSAQGFFTFSPVFRSISLAVLRHFAGVLCIHNWLRWLRLSV